MSSPIIPSSGRGKRYLNYLSNSRLVYLLLRAINSSSDFSDNEAFNRALDSSNDSNSTINLMQGPNNVSTPMRKKPKPELDPESSFSRFQSFVESEFPG